MRTNTLWMFGLLSASICSVPLLAQARDMSGRERGAHERLLQERQELARQEAQLAQDTIALEERRAELAKRRAALIAHEQDMAENRMARRNRRGSSQNVDQSLANLGARESDRGFVLTLSDIQFRRDESELSAETMRKLYPLATLLKDESGRSIIIEGYTDSTGDESYNQQLSERRASAVRDFLVSTGIDPQRISVRGYGEEHPVASNETASGQRENRRVEIIVARDSEPQRSAER
jgi:outer membrane protein OmpA-like peptidoglycan-associated protein